ncbi:putative ABC-type xenobiotic transporter [Helianthus anomalus]
MTVCYGVVCMAYVGESRALQAYSSALKISQKLGYKTGFFKGFGLGATYFTVFCCYALLLWYGGYLVRNNHTNGGLAIATMFCVMIGGLALGQSSPSMSAFAKARVSAAKLFQIIDHKPSVGKNGETGIELNSVSGLVELKDVNFSYPSRPDVKILNNFSLSVPSGKTIALVGSSGSGKSTVVSLIERFYDPTSGWGEGVTIIRRSKAENRDSTCDVKESRNLVLLDEATSALDSESEKLVQEALDRFMIGRTTLVIAHRLSTIRMADLVAVLQQGGVLEMGTHDELFAKGENGVYAKLIKMQEIAHETAMSGRFLPDKGNINLNKSKDQLITSCYIY